VKRVLATGTFDILHPGHLYYLEESRKLGDVLYVIVARDANVKHKPYPFIPEEQRRIMVAALKPVDHAILGDPTDMFRPVREIDPDVITIGFNQHFDETRLKKELFSRGLRAGVVRIGSCPEKAICSSRRIVSGILSRESVREKTD
jgi:FAD synthetase